MRKTIITLLMMMGMLSLQATGNANEKIQNRLPKYGQLKLDLQENVMIKEIDGDPNYQFGAGLWDLAVDKQGNLYVLDYDRLLKYDSGGKFVGTIAKKGEGPGEFLPPDKIFIHERGDVYISDRNRFLQVFGSDGKYIKKIVLDFTISPNEKNLFVDRDDNIFAATMEMSESGLKTVLVKADPNGKTLNKIKVAKDDNFKIQGSSRGGVIGGLVHE